MRRTIRWTLILGVTGLLFSGCATKTTNIDINNDKGDAVMGLDYRDFQGAAQDMIESLLASGAVNKPNGERYVLVVSRIINDTMQHIDTDQLVKKIRVGLLRSGKVVVTTAVGVNGAEDTMAMKTRKELRVDDEFNQKTVAGKGSMIAPDLSLSGKILQRNIRVDKSTQRVEYYFQMSLTDIKTGLAFWEDERVIGKRGSNKSVAW
ncbi:penicillin-binding protein activator LpoB [Candidatus Sulfurimonas marisnigri]|uniref:Penicillin-binding protein activator LpoB n=1 Tax=Candidatus Sulfurimonas marisnigri TaxID=2740405 RepID=A0A7S7RRB8_9BACT|nr:penicillin-binding protein activator LpoB [Candidatus Sulfurimonas marisnigri]QOY55380.1 penicillin-binding protein activator LpoB [Candidatus Sulfurimonas marisnigri]